MDQDFNLNEDEDERKRLLERDRAISDEELVARMKAAPDMGGALLDELSEFVTRRSKRQAPLPPSD
ncbi:hypothetical protein WDZ92_25250 [Nostoc sp. NIES-2111]